MVIDDFGVSVDWPRRYRGEIDGPRQFWLEHPRLVTTELRLDADAVTLVGTRRD